VRLCLEVRAGRSFLKQRAVIELSQQLLALNMSHKQKKRLKIQVGCRQLGERLLASFTPWQGG